VARWPVGVGLTSWRYLWRTTPLHRSERGAHAWEYPLPPLPAGTPTDDLLTPEGGAGPVFHRIYRARIRGAATGPEQLFAQILGDPDRPAPSEFATFQKARGAEGTMRPGDEYVVRMPGPWDGPVRVVDVSPTSFRLATLQGHLEAGQIEFRARPDGEDLIFEIESWASSGDRVSQLLYTRLRMSKEVQLHMWTSFIERVARMAGGRLSGGIEIRTVRLEEEREAVVGPEARRALDAARREPENFDWDEATEASQRRGWRHDERWQTLPSEAPGDPVPGGPFETARRLVRDYEFSDPALVRATFDRDEPLERRVMILELRYLVLRFVVPVRVSRVVDEARPGPGGPARVWGWSYRTLRGHVEAGERSFEVWKHTETGEVHFRTHAVSRVSSRNPFWRIAFRYLGRRRQADWVRRICERMAVLTDSALERRSPGAAGGATTASGSPRR
jgi:uncharacterized protein (UPF0548 family)